MSTFFVRSVSTPVEAICKQCGGGDMHRLISRVASKVSSGASSEGEYYKDPSNIGRRVEDSFGKFGVDVPESVRKTIDDARQGKMPEGLDL